MRKHINMLITILSFAVLILDTKTALRGASEGIEMCVRTVIPSLFPFIFLSGILTHSLATTRIPLLRPIGRLLHIPNGCEPLLVISFLGGYPVGAQCVATAVRDHSISQETGKRMLAFCNNAGPAFLFGIGSHLFAEKWVCWVIWAIHILSALLVGLLFNRSEKSSKSEIITVSPSAMTAMERSVRTIAIICGWVILFRMILQFMTNWFLWRFPLWAQCLLSGIMELANGCYSLAEIAYFPLRFLLFSTMLGFGGCCVALQTLNVTQGMDASYYLPGKLLQALFSCILSAAIVYPQLRWYLLLLPIAIIFARCHRKKSEKCIAFSQDSIYNGRKSIGGHHNAIS